jgi:hypothetical protein
MSLPNCCLSFVHFLPLHGILQSILLLERDIVMSSEVQKCKVREKLECRLKNKFFLGIKVNAYLNYLDSGG